MLFLPDGPTAGDIDGVISLALGGDVPIGPWSDEFQADLEALAAEPENTELLIAARKSGAELIRSWKS